jgi:hypothetical protein
MFLRTNILRMLVQMPSQDRTPCQTESMLVYKRLDPQSIVVALWKFFALCSTCWLQVETKPCSDRIMREFNDRPGNTRAFDWNFLPMMTRSVANTMMFFHCVTVNERKQSKAWSNKTKATQGNYSHTVAVRKSPRKRPKQ